MTDDQRSGMEPDKTIRPGRAAEDDDPNAEGHLARPGRATEDQQPGDQGSGMEPDEGITRKF